MKNLDAFNSFLKPKVKEKIKNNKIIGYSRVSSKDQLKNYSIREQESEIRAYAKRNDYELVEIVGGTYESARNDFTRKEFTRLYNLVKKSKPRPYAIAIRTINRFSRSGASAITIVEEMVEKLGVHLIETSTGLCTDNIKDRLTIHHRLIEALEENQERLAITIPGMKKYLKMGYWLGVAPFGYTTYGPRVRDFKNRKEEQEIVINKNGAVLKQAWQWKLAGERDSVIIKKMERLGVKVTKQRLSDVWRNPFYSGVSINNLLDKPVMGRWEPMVSTSEFFRVHQLLNPDKGAKYKVDNINDARPLSRFLICSECGYQLTGYVVKKKNVHYYKCNVCTGVNLNANTTKRSIYPGLNDTFLKLLQTLKLQSINIEPFKMQLKKLFNHLHKETTEELKAQKKLKVRLEEMMDKLQHKYIYDDLDPDIYENEKLKLNNDKLKNEQNITELESKLSNHEIFIEDAVQVVQNISKYWNSGDLDTKHRIQKTVFPNGLVLNPLERKYLTKNINRVFLVKPSKSNKNKGMETKKVGENTDLSCKVAGAGLEPTTFGL